MSAPNITVKFLDPEELDSIKTKISEPKTPPDEQTKEEVPEIVQAESVNAASPNAESLKDNIAHEESNIQTEKPQLSRVDSSAPKTKEDQSANKMHERKKLLGSALDHSRRRSGETLFRETLFRETTAPGHGGNNKVGIGLMVAGIVGLLLTGRS